MNTFIEVVCLFGKNKFWENTRDKFKLDKSPLLGNCLLKYNLAVINLTDICKYIQMYNLKFEDVFTNAVIHETLHLLIMKEISTPAEAEEEIIYSMIGLP